MKKEVYKSSVYIFLIMTFLVVFSVFVSASLFCEVKQDCSDTTIFRLSSNTNAHAELLSGAGGYEWDVCCRIEDVPDTLSTDCENPDAYLVNLSSETNAHVETAGYSDYEYGVCLSADIGPITCTTRNPSCNADEICIFSQSSETNAHAADCITDPYNLKTCCKYCEECVMGNVTGNVKNTDGEDIEDAEVDLMQNGVVRYTNYTKSLGNYKIADAPSGNYDIIASADGYISSIKSVEIPAGNSVTEDFVLVEGTTCEDDCTYAGDNIIHKECNGINGCAFCDEAKGCGFCDPEKVADACNFAQPGWLRVYEDDNPSRCLDGCVIECAEGCPKDKVTKKATVTCEYGNLIKMIKLIPYKGKLVKLVVVVCG